MDAKWHILAKISRHSYLIIEAKHIEEMSELLSSKGRGDWASDSSEHRRKSIAGLEFRGQ